MSFIKRTVYSAEADEKCLVAEHSSGLKVYICEKPNLSSNYAVFGTHYGSVDTEFSLNNGPVISVPEGIAHFLEHKLFEYEDGDAFEKYAVTGASANAYTSFDRTCYLFSCSDKFFENLDILLDFVSVPYFTAETVQKEQGIIGQEIRMYQDSPEWRVFFNLLRTLFSKHPVRIDIAGTIGSIAKITDKTLFDCYHTFYNPSNMFLCICGNMDQEKVLATVDSKIKTAEKTVINRSSFNEPDEVVNNYFEQLMPVSIPLFNLGIKDNKAKLHRTHKTELATELLLEITAGSVSPLYNRLLNEGLLNSNFGFEYFFGHGYAALFFEGESKSPETVRDMLLSELKAIAENGVDKELFEDAKRKLYGQEIRGCNSAERVVKGFIDCAMIGYEPYETFSLLKDLTADDITARARELDLSKSALSVVKQK